jgi:hypothetical protein
LNLVVLYIIIYELLHALPIYIIVVYIVNIEIHMEDCMIMYKCVISLIKVFTYLLTYLLIFEPYEAMT